MDAGPAAAVHYKFVPRGRQHHAGADPDVLARGVCVRLSGVSGKKCAVPARDGDDDGAGRGDDSVELPDGQRHGDPGHLQRPDSAVPDLGDGDLSVPAVLPELSDVAV